MPSLCLCMMVRNEAAVIERALLSALPYIDGACILDTGSEDDTLAIVHRTLGALDHIIFQSDWVDFAHGRTQAAHYASRMGYDYLLVMDADQTLVVSDPLAFEMLMADAYNIEIKHAGLTYPHPWLLKAGLEWRWEDATHEYLVDTGRRYGPPITGAYLQEHGDSYRRKTGAKGREDRQLLEAAYADNPEDTRTVFYLGQCCHDEGKLACAIKWYAQRVKMGGWLEEAFMAQYRIGNCHDLAGNWNAAVTSYLDAYQMLPKRAEPLFRLGNGYFLRHKFAAAVVFFEAAAQIDKPVAALFVEAAVYDYASLQGFAWCCRALNRMEEAEEAEAMLCGDTRVPKNVVDAINNAIETRTFGALT